MVRRKPDCIICIIVFETIGNVFGVGYSMALSISMKGILVVAALRLACLAKRAPVFFPCVYQAKRSYLI